MGWKETEKQTIESTTNAGADCHVEKARDQDRENARGSFGPCIASSKQLHCVTCPFTLFRRFFISFQCDSILQSSPSLLAEQLAQAFPFTFWRSH